MWTGKFWKAAGERAIRTFAQAALAVLGVAAAGDVASAGVLDVDWLRVLSVALLAAVISVLMSLGTQAAQGDGPGVTEVPTESAAEAVGQAAHKVNRD